ncbi:MAG: hypothetical protein ACREU9_01570 [Gammaproteobacteria bacterium]
MKTLALSANLRKGNSKSCGCLKREQLAERRTTHGHTAGGSETKAYSAWWRMTRRCLNKNHDRYQYYGGRGIMVCERWRRFANFFADMGDPPKGYSIDRIDNDGNYEPGNCRWATRTEQVRNRRTTVKVAYEGTSTPLAALCERFGVDYDRTWERIKVSGWTVEQALSGK